MNKKPEQVIMAIENLVADDLCQDLSAGKLTAKEMRLVFPKIEKKLSMIYKLAHSFNRQNACYPSHKNWRDELKYLLEL